jgi:hypothetical protein
MLHPMDHDGLVVLEDLIDDSVVTTTSRVQPFELPQQWLPETLWVVGNGAENRCECCFSCLLRKAVQVSKTLRSDLDFIHTRFLGVVLEPKPLAASGLVT